MATCWAVQGPGGPRDPSTLMGSLVSRMSQYIECHAVLTIRQQLWAYPHPTLPHQVIPAEFLVQLAVHDPPLVLLFGSLRTPYGSRLGRASVEAGIRVYHPSDLRDDINRDCITAD